MKTYYRKDIEKFIYDKFDGKINLTNISDAVSAILDFLKTEITNDRPVSIKNFGTFSPFTVKSHLGIDVNSGRMRVTRAFMGVRLHPHASFLSLIASHRPTFSERAPHIKREGR